MIAANRFKPSRWDLFAEDTKIAPISFVTSATTKADTGAGDSKASCIISPIGAIPDNTTGTVSYSNFEVRFYETWRRTPLTLPEVCTSSFCLAAIVTIVVYPKRDCRRHEVLLCRTW